MGVMSSKKKKSYGIVKLYVNVLNGKKWCK